MWRWQDVLLRRWRNYIERRGGLKVTRSQLVARLEVEAHLLRGLRTLLLALLTFTTVAWLSLPRTGSTMAGAQAEFGLLTTYKHMLGLDAVKEVYSAPELRDFLSDLSVRSRTMQPLSDVYFHEEQGDVHVVAGDRTYRKTESVSTLVIDPRVDSPAFTLAAWVQTQPAASGAFVLRKPLGTDVARSSLSCWGWFLGDIPRFDFGAHDYTGDVSMQQESVALDHKDGALPNGGRRWTAGEGEPLRMHFEAIVVNQESISFFQDAVLVASRPLPRAVTDCAGAATLEVGAVGSRLADITFYARALAQQELAEIAYYGTTLANLATGKQAFVPHVTGFDSLASTQSVQNDEVKSEFELTRESLSTEQVYTRALDDAPDPAATRAPPLMEAVSGCRRTWPTCNVLPPVNETLTTDDLLEGRKYHRLSPPESRSMLPGSAGNWATAAHYDPLSFPSFRGTSVTFSGWFKMQTRSYFLVKHHSATKKYPRCVLHSCIAVGTAIAKAFMHRATSSMQDSPWQNETANHLPDVGISIPS